MNSELILDDFERQLPLFRELEAYLSRILAEVTREHDVKIHSLTSRIKARESLRAKLIQPDRTYKELGDITDILGFRIITYFEDSVELLAEVIERHFAIDFANSVDKRQSAACNEFGYRSPHYIARLPAASGAPQALCNLRFERNARAIPLL